MSFLDERDVAPPAPWLAALQYSVFRSFVAFWLGQHGLNLALVTSGLRNPADNERVGGAANSAHMHGLAVDVAVSGPRARELADAWGALGPGWYSQVYPTSGHVHLGAPRDLPLRVLIAACAAFALVVVLVRAS